MVNQVIQQRVVNQPAEIKRIIIVASYTLELNNLKEYQCFSSDESYSVSVVDLTAVYRGKERPGFASDALQESSTRINRLRSLKEFRDFVRHNDAVYFVYTSDHLSEILIRLVLRRSVVITFSYSLPNEPSFGKYTKLLFTPKSLLTRGVSYIKNVIRRVLLATLCPKHYVSTIQGSIASRKPNSIIDEVPVSISGDDFSKPSNQRQIAFVFQNFVFKDYDFKREGESKPDFSIYFDLVRLLLNGLSDANFKPILFFHPKTNLADYPAWSIKYQCFRGVEQSLMRESGLVLGHFSQALLLARALNVHIVLLDCALFESNTWVGRAMQSFKLHLGIDTLPLEIPELIIRHCLELYERGKCLPRHNVSNNFCDSFSNLKKTINLHFS